METTNTEEHQNDAPTPAVTTGMSVHSTSRQESYTGPSFHSTSRTESTGHDQSSLQVPVSETLPTDMSDTTESEAEKQSAVGEGSTIPGHHGIGNLISGTYYILESLSEVFLYLFINSFKICSF
jgi:hypothetical protein